MKLLKDLQKEYQSDKEVIQQLTDEFGDYSEYEKEYDEFFNNELIKEIEQLPNGNVAGAGPVDYNEGKVLFMYIRKHKPTHILELGMAAGCSAVIMAKALELNEKEENLPYNNRYVLSVDISDDNFDASIPLYKNYYEKDLVRYALGIDAIKFLQEEQKSGYPYDMVFVDASHQSEFCFEIASLIKKYYSHLPIFYHEWGLSDKATPKEQSYVSLTENISRVGFHDVAEREAFEETFPNRLYEHKGFYGSSGLGLVRPKVFNVFYRISSKSAFTNKDKLTDKMTCLRNFLQEFARNKITIQADNCSVEIQDKIVDLVTSRRDRDIKVINTNHNSSSDSFMSVLNMVKELDDDELVYIVEDDYLHYHFANNILLEGIGLGSHYITLYTHPDKFIPASKGGNPQIGEDGAEITKVFKTNNSYWMLTNSTCLTFATTAKHIKDDYDIWKKCVFETPSLGSYYAFTEIRKKGKSLIMSLPAKATHTEIKWLAPTIGLDSDWSNLI